MSTTTDPAAWTAGFTIMRRLPLDDQLTLAEFRAANDPTPRMYRSNVELRLHTDITDMLSICSIASRASRNSAWISICAAAI